jgi:hypothetical protein
MNVLELVPTPANARRIKRLMSIMNLSVDPVVADLAELDVFDAAAAFDALPPTQRSIAASKFTSVVSYLADYNWRGMIVANDDLELLKAQLLTALVSGLRPISIVTVDSSNRKIEAITSKLNSLNIDYEVIDDRFSGLTKDVVVVSPINLTHAVLRELRKGICINQSTNICAPNYPLYPSPGQKINKLVNYELLGMEFEHLILGIAENQFEHRYSQDHYYQKKQILHWYETKNFCNALPALHPEQNFGELFDVGNNQFIQKRGFILSAPDHFAKIIGINLDLLNA